MHIKRVQYCRRHIRNHFQPEVRLINKEKEVIAWFTLILNQSLLLLVVENKNYGAFSNSKYNFSKKLCVRQLLYLLRK